MPRKAWFISKTFATLYKQRQDLFLIRDLPSPDLPPVWAQDEVELLGLTAHAIALVYLLSMNRPCQPPTLPPANPLTLDSLIQPETRVQIV